MEKKALGVLEIVLIICILGVIALLLIYAVNPKKIMEKSRDSQRLEDLTAIGSAINLYLADGKDFSKIQGGKVYSSTEDRENATKNDGTGWIPLDLTKISSGMPIRTLGVDPKNDQASGLYYRFGANVTNKTYEIDCRLENADNLSKASQDGGNNPERYEVGTDLTILL